ncbi:hypothetical protein HYT57_05085 [Candidatus Woesearchaeota archaeon]|nr:hypothetical protein [Candidatus Woesearchaeota archaeon]
MEIPKIPLPPGVKKQDIALYGITGWFLDSSLDPPGPVAFGGYFKVNKRDGAVGAGQICDFYGISYIEHGLMMDEELQFEKEYEGRDYAILYRLRKSGNIWVGEFLSPRVDSPGSVKALITLVEEDAFQLVAGKMMVR